MNDCFALSSDVIAIEETDLPKQALFNFINYKKLTLYYGEFFIFKKHELYYLTEIQIPIIVKEHLYDMCNIPDCPIYEVEAYSIQTKDGKKFVIETGINLNDGPIEPSYLYFLKSQYDNFKTSNLKKVFENNKDTGKLSSREKGEYNRFIRCLMRLSDSEFVKKREELFNIMNTTEKDNDNVQWLEGMTKGEVRKILKGALGKGI